MQKIERVEGQELNTTEQRTEVYTDSIQESIANYCIDHDIEIKASSDKEQIYELDFGKDGADGKGQYYETGITLYDLAVLVLEDAGVAQEDYYLDTYLKKITVYNPLPNVRHKEALQIIANAGRCSESGGDVIWLSL